MTQYLYYGRKLDTPESFSVETTCNQSVLPPIRNPVSSRCFTGAALTLQEIFLTTGSIADLLGGDEICTNDSEYLLIKTFLGGRFSAG